MFGKEPLQQKSFLSSEQGRNKENKKGSSFFAWTLGILGADNEIRTRDP